MAKAQPGVSPFQILLFHLTGKFVPCPVFRSGGGHADIVLDPDAAKLFEQIYFRPVDVFPFRFCPEFGKQRFSIGNAYPNPFNPATTIGYSIPEQGAVNWQVYDTQEKLIFRAPEKVYPAGHHQVFFDGKHLSSGMYFIKMRYHSQIKTIKLLLAK